MKRYITYAYQNHLPVSIDEVDSGLACNCVCPFCKTKLIAKKGNIRIHHFAHVDASECERAYEASLQLMIRDILAKEKRLMLPQVVLRFRSLKEDQIISKAKMIDLDHVQLENTFDAKVPDVVVYVKNRDGSSRRFYIEVQVNDVFDADKKEKIIRSDVSVIRIDVSRYTDTVSYRQMMAILLKDAEDKTWLTNVKVKQIYQKFIQKSETKKFIHRANTLQADDCPVNKREFHGRSYANVIRDCKYCEYCVLMDAGKEHLCCTGKQLVSKYEDLFIPLEERKRRKEEEKKKEEERQNLLKQSRNSFPERIQHAETDPVKEGYKEIKDKDFCQNEHMITDSFDLRWVKCEVCGKIRPFSEFNSYGGYESMNRGICMECAKKYDPETGEYHVQQKS